MTNIQARITTRKILLVCMYEYHFQDEEDQTISKDTLIEHCEYIYTNFFCYKKNPPVDWSYLEKVGTRLFDLQQEVIDAVNKHVTSFAIETMDKMEQSLFLLGYTEWKYGDTDDKIILNEMIELSKRYSKPSTFRLINSIFHKIFEQQNT